MAREEGQEMVLSAADARALQKPCVDAAAEFLEKPRANVVGLGVGVKWRNGQATKDPALVVLVAQKIAKELVGKTDMVPAKLQDVQTDVLAVGYPFAGDCAPADAGVHTLAARARPVKGGYSVGHKNITAGTTATCVYDILPGGAVSPPRHGMGIPAKYYILSNNHVLANSNAASPGDAVLQPGPYDGGADPADRIASLSRFIPIMLDPPVARTQHRNLVDAAIAEAPFHQLDRELHWIGRVQGWRRRADVTVGTLVQKTGRTTNYTIGRITAVNATVDINYGGGRVARFSDQIVTSNFSAPGDSGSLVTTLDNVAVGLLFAGSSVATIVNQIENVRALLRVEVAERIIP